MISWTCIHRQEEYRNVMCPFCIQNICSFVQPCCEIKNESCGECVHHGGCLELVAEFVNGVLDINNKRSSTAEDVKHIKYVLYTLCVCCGLFCGLFCGIFCGIYNIYNSKHTREVKYYEKVSQLYRETPSNLHYFVNQRLAMIHTRDLKYSDYALRRLKVDILHWQAEIERKQGQYMQIKAILDNQGGGNEADDESDASQVTKGNGKMEIDSDDESKKSKTKRKFVFTEDIPLNNNDFVSKNDSQNVKKSHIDLTMTENDLKKWKNNINKQNYNINNDNNNNNSEKSVQGIKKSDEVSSVVQVSDKSKEVSKELKHDINGNGDHSGELVSSVMVANKPQDEILSVEMVPVGVNKDISSLLPITVVAANPIIEERAGSTDAVHGGDDSGGSNANHSGSGANGVSDGNDVSGNNNSNNGNNGDNANHSGSGANNVNDSGSGGNGVNDSGSAGSGSGSGSGSGDSGTGSGGSGSGSGDSGSGSGGSASGTSTDSTVTSNSDNNNNNGNAPPPAKSGVETRDTEDASLSQKPLQKRPVIVLRDYNKQGPVVPTLSGDLKPRSMMVFPDLPSLGECPIKSLGNVLPWKPTDNDASAGGQAQNPQ